MDFSEIVNIAFSIIATVGTSGAIILGLSNWLGKIWAERILNSDRERHQRNIELFKSELSSEVEILKSDLSLDVERLKAELSSDVERLRSVLALKLEISRRLSENQFHLYNDLWSSLYDLKIVGDRLWEGADSGTVKNFARQLKKTESKVFRSSLLIENDHYERLKRLIEEFNEFKFGKEQLVRLRDMPGSSITFRTQDIQDVITHNGSVRDKYSKLIDEIEIFFKNQMRGIE